ncbi:hypothetical protein P152DRAFT_94368 [Eremomyces bilateralis CBS 781.70]|uniref:Transcription factor IIA, alpha/beta subunit n=1 Tax=Eremomyces bilateralis CBS 781.70 TaxID=1392243 RepID=A0A6G1FYC9_9PEZI|nr:uncharacterized protein P152DRAFT_94368 [Eremomyces bilateralis CBS 781.70]KAF1810722.1 hypothetical protein P152DRAFT_94368 [Eremomyces bilateralis CBS 781.70]
MSNQIVGQTYQEIISRVITESQSAFEEAGLPADVLKELREEWQQRLSDLKVAQFPWDPPPSAQNPPTLPSNARAHDLKTEEGKHPGQTSVVYDTPSRLKQGSTVKQEPLFKQDPDFKREGAYDSQPPAPSGPQANGYNAALTAQQRAQAQLQREYGQHANASIAAMSQAQGRQNGMQGQLPQQGQPQQGQLPQQGQPPQQHPHQQQPRPAQSQPAPQQQHPSVGSAQTDGPGDLPEPLDNRRLEADASIRDQIEALREQMDNGLLLPYTSSRHAKLKARSKTRTPRAGPSREAGPSQFDGGDDVLREEEDEDAINSDLDDPDDDPQRQEEQEEEIKEVILCTYDKVQRVKNKWKCTLKDGILTTNDKEYLFHKGTGEFEW